MPILRAIKPDLLQPGNQEPLSIGWTLSGLCWYVLTPPIIAGGPYLSWTTSLMNDLFSGVKCSSYFWKHKQIFNNICILHSLLMLPCLYSLDYEKRYRLLKHMNWLKNYRTHVLLSLCTVLGPNSSKRKPVWDFNLHCLTFPK